LLLPALRPGRQSRPMFRWRIRRVTLPPRSAMAGTVPDPAEGTLRHADRLIPSGTHQETISFLPRPSHLGFEWPSAPFRAVFPRTSAA